MKPLMILLALAVTGWAAYKYGELGARRTDPAASAGLPTPGVALAAQAAPRAVPTPTSTPAPTPTPARRTRAPRVSPTPANSAPSATLAPGVLGAVVTITGHEGAGTGFICRFQNKIYVATNQHVLKVGNPLAIRTSDGLAIVPRQVIAAADADIALIQCDALPPGVAPLEIAKLPDPAVQKDDPVMVPGNSKGDGVITVTPGKLLAVGPQRTEVDNPVYPGNSGSPIVHLQSGKVISVLTEAELVTFGQFEKASFRSRNSSIKSEIRYFGHRIDSVQKWEPLDWNYFQATEAIIKQSRSELDAVFAYLTNSSSASYKNFSELHAARNNALKTYNDHNSSNADKTEAYERLLRDVEAFARLARRRLDNRKIYYIQQDSVETISRLSDAILGGTAIAKRDRDLVATLLDRGN